LNETVSSSKIKPVYADFLIFFQREIGNLKLGNRTKLILKSSNKKNDFFNVA